MTISLHKCNIKQIFRVYVSYNEVSDAVVVNTYESTVFAVNILP